MLSFKKAYLCLKPEKEIMIFSSKLIEDAVAAFCQLPGIGKKTALRMVLHLLKEEKDRVDNFTQTIARMRDEIAFCPQCNNVSDGGLCAICANSGRISTQVCVVESIRDVISIESTQQYNGLYHVLGGLLSPLEGIGPDQLLLDNLLKRVSEGRVEEMIMALSPTIEGDTTVYYINRQLKNAPVRVTGIARGISFGGDLEYTDELTLGRAITKRLPVEHYVNMSD